jgi:putative ABC transport system substrate-binding protein
LAESVETQCSDSRRARRWFILSAAAAVAIPGELFSQSPDRPRRVQILAEQTPESEPYRKAMVEALRAHGWIEGRNLLVERHYGHGNAEEVPKLASEIVRAAPDVIIAFGPVPAVALRNTGTTIPVVFVVVFDPIRLGLAKSLARPGGTFTGLATAVPEGFLGKVIELLREAVPNMKRIALLSNPRNPIHAMYRERNLKNVSDLGLEAILVQAATREELEPAFREAAARGANGMNVGGDAVTVQNGALIAELALRYRLPTMFLFDVNVEAGGLMSYGADLVDLYRRSADYVDKILRGAKPADLPIEQPTKFALVINLKTARALGLTIPQTLRLRADRVIQ